jgi:hypothetical protein
MPYFVDLIRFLVVIAVGVIICVTAMAQTPCAGGTGSPITSLSTTPTSLCLPAQQGSRVMLNIQNSNAGGGASLLCSWESTVALTNSAYDFVVYPQGTTWFYAPAWVPGGLIACMSSSGTSTLKATVVQLGAP